MNYHFSKLLDQKIRLIIAATRVSYFSGFQRIILLKNLENLYFLISKHFDFTFHFSKKSEHIFFTFHFSKKSESTFLLCTSQKRVNAFIFHFSLLELPRPTPARACHMGENSQPNPESDVIFKKVSVSVSKNLVLKKVSVSVSKYLVSKKSLSIG